MGEGRVYQLKFRVPTALEFFETFSKKFKSSQPLPGWDETTPWTRLVLKTLIRDMGQEFGFEPQPPPQEWLGLDQIWPLTVERQVSTIAVAIEHEASVESWENVVDDEGSKLIDVKARLKILVHYPETGDFEAFAKGWASGIMIQELRLVEEHYLLIGICADIKNKQLLVRGAEISPEGKIRLLNDVTVPYTKFSVPTKSARPQPPIERPAD